MGQPATEVTLSDAGVGTVAEDAAVLADMQTALAAWAPHLLGLGTLVVQVNVVDDGQTGELADGAPTVGVAVGTLDGRHLLEASSVYELLTGQHLEGSDITVDVNSAYLSDEYLGTSGAVPPGEYDLLTVLTHEIGHGLGIGGETSTTGSLNPDYETMWDHFLTQVNGVEVFDGPNAEAVNGGPVAVTTLGNGEGYAHLANSEADPNADDLMSGLGLPAGVTRTVSDLDLAILADTGVPISGFAGTVSLAGTPNAAVPGIEHLLTGLSLADSGALTTSRLTLTVAAGTGTLSALPGSGAAVATSGGGHTLVATGSLAQVQAQLAALDYVAAAAGSDTLTLSAADGFGNAGTGTVTVDVAGATPAVASVQTTAAVAAASAPGPVVLSGGESFSADAGADVVMATGGSAAVTASAAAGSSLALFAQAGSVSFTGGGGSAVVVGTGAAALSLAGGAAGSSLLAFAGPAAVQYAGGSGADEIVGGAGALSLAGGAGGSLLVFGGAGALTLQGGGERDLVVGGAGAETVHAGAGGVFAGTGGSLLFADGSGTFLAGNTGGDRLTASTAGGDILAAGAGAETLDGGAAATGDILFGGTGSDLLRLGGGADTAVAGLGGGTIVFGAGPAQVFLGGGAAQTLVLGGGGTDTVSGFRPGTDRLNLPAGVTATMAGGVLSLSDGTRVTLPGVPAG